MLTYRRAGLQERCFSRQAGVGRPEIGWVIVNLTYRSTGYRGTSVRTAAYQNNSNSNTIVLVCSSASVVKIKGHVF